MHYWLQKLWNDKCLEVYFDMFYTLPYFGGKSQNERYDKRLDMSFTEKREKKILQSEWELLNNSLWRQERMHEIQHDFFIIPPKRPNLNSFLEQSLHRLQWKSNICIPFFSLFQPFH